jgi:hypothetical protein
MRSMRQNSNDVHVGHKPIKNLSYHVALAKIDYYKRIGIWDYVKNIKLVDWPYITD